MGRMILAFQKKNDTSTVNNQMAVSKNSKQELGLGRVGESFHLAYSTPFSFHVFESMSLGLGPSH